MTRVEPVDGRDPGLAATRARGHGRIVAALILVAFARQLVLIVATPPYQGHDEVVHMAYFATLAGEGRVPTLADRIPAGLFAYSRYTLDWPALYAAAHPPLYYLLGLPIFDLAGENWLARLYALRLFSVPFYLVTIWLAYRLVSEIFPNDSFLLLTVPAWIAFQPQFGYEGAIVNNDIGAICAGTALLWLVVRAWRVGLTAAGAASLGVTLGAGLLVKATLLAFAPLVALPWAAYAWATFHQRGGRPGWWRDPLAAGALLAVPALLLPLPWYLFLYRTYGDFTAGAALQTLQATWSPPQTAAHLLGAPGFYGDRLREYFGDFGWKLIPLLTWQTVGTAVLLAVAAAGLLFGAIRAVGARRRGELPLERSTLEALGLLALANGLFAVAIVYLGTVMWLTQARYAFPVAAATGVLLMLGIRALLPTRVARPAAAVTIALFAVFNFLVLSQLVIPYGVLTVR